MFTYGLYRIFNPLSGNVPYFIILLCLMPDNFTRQRESVATQWVKQSFGFTVIYHISQHCRSQDITGLQCTPLLPSALDADQNTAKQTPWKGWKPLSNESSPQTNKENNNEFPPLTNGNIFDPWSVGSFNFILLYRHGNNTKNL